MVLNADEEEVRPGGAASVAHLASNLGANVAVAGFVGKDTNGNVLRSLLKESGVVDLTANADRQTTTKERFLGRAENRHTHQILRVDYETTHEVSRSEEFELLDRIESAGNQFDAVLISDYSKGCCTPTLVRQLIELASANNIPVIADPSRRDDYTLYEKATAITPNRSEAEQVLNTQIATPSEAKQAAERLLDNLQLRHVFLTLDKDGIVVASQNEATEHFPTRVREAYDITGAGDMVLAMTGVCLASGVPLAETAKLANIAAGLEVERIGVAAVSPSEIEAAIGAGQPPAKVLKRDALASLADVWRKAGEKIVFTNGCFDILHAGHVQYLQEAARLGDRLVVAVNSDQSVKAIKGESRPIIEQSQRAALLAALECVDHVVVFDELTPHVLLHLIRPDVLVKGGTYAPDEVVGREVVDDYGGVVRVLSLVTELSTTSIIRTIEHNASRPM